MVSHGRGSVGTALRDVLGVLKVQGERLDYAYVRRWAAQLSVQDLLERALTEAS